MDIGSMTSGRQWCLPSPDRILGMGGYRALDRVEECVGLFLVDVIRIRMHMREKYFLFCSCARSLPLQTHGQHFCNHLHRTEFHRY